MNLGLSGVAHRYLLCSPTMSSHRDLSSLPPAVLRAALEASEKRVQRERDKIKKEMCQLQKRLDKLEKKPDPPKQEKPEKPVASGSEDKIKQQKVDPESGDKPVEVIDVDDWYDRQWPIAKVRKPGGGAGR